VAEYWNSEPEDSMSYLDILNDPSFPPTTGGEFTEAGPSGNDFTNHTFDAANSIGSDLSNIPENVDMSWALYDASSSSTSTAPTYNFDHTPAAAQGYSFSDVDYLPRFRFGPTIATDNSPHPNPFLPPPVVGPSPPVSPNLVPQESVMFPDNPKKRLRISNITEENILPDNQRRKRSRPDKLSL
jgi:hypothetical protein